MTEIEFLGTGTSTGVPQIGCNCEVCRSNDHRDRRLRCSAIVRVDGVSLLLDCGPDFRSQILQVKDRHLDALLLTHSHYDHVGGMDDLRPYCVPDSFDVYGQPNVLADIRARIPYCFIKHPYPGVPSFELHELNGSPFFVRGVKVVPLPVMHYKLPVYGYRIGKLAYITDCKSVPESTYPLLDGVEVLVINALRIEPHLSHFCLKETLQVIERVKPKKAYLIHMSHGIGLARNIGRLVPRNVEFAYDGMKVIVEK